VLNPNVGDMGNMAEPNVALGRSGGDAPGLSIGTLGFEKSFAAALPTDSALYVVAKRCVDMLIACGALIVLLPFFLLAIVLIRAQGPGPIIYRQPRIGIRGRRFSMYKFRSMKPDRRGQQVDIEFGDRRVSLKTNADPRITAIGRFLRTTSLDELPQIFNVLKGDMSIVGPRPEQPEMLRYYRPEHYQRHVVLPGLTGWWQINARCNRPARVIPRQDLDAKLQDDLFYLEHRSFWFDLQIILRTVWVVLRRRGAY
jgi:lipopolysaccharide/colanic/teichoic acid biosynthesis glycosyltransferase